MICCYDMQRRLPTFDFYGWLACVRMQGATEITFSLGRKFFMRKKWPPEESHRRLASILTPGPALAGLPGRMGEDGDREIGSHKFKHLRTAMKRFHCPMPRLRSVLPPKKARYTVTMREMTYKSHRNSDRAVWLAFAREIGARVIEDWSVDAMSLHERVAFYAGAEMNFGVPTGPLSLLYWTEYPFCEVADPEVCAEDFANQDMEVGEQPFWLLPNQRVVWGKPTLELLMELFDGTARGRPHRGHSAAPHVAETIG